MRFGKSAQEAEQDKADRPSGGDWIKYLKDGDTTFRILQEPDDWVYFGEHFGLNGVNYPCSNEEDCPGCNSDNERVSKVSRRVAFNVLQGYNGRDYVNVYKIAPTAAEKLQNRFARLGTITDRDYTITRYKTAGDRYDFDVEGSMPSPVDTRSLELKDIESMLASAWNDAWGPKDDPWKEDSDKEQRDLERINQAKQAHRAKKATIAPSPKQQELPHDRQDDEPPFEQERVYQEADLRAMPYEDLVILVKEDLGSEPPATARDTNAVVDWLMNLQS